MEEQDVNVDVAQQSDESSPTMSSASGNVIASIVGAIASIITQFMENKNQRDLLQSEQQWNEDMWNKENEYNSYSNQMQRFRDAGVNPALAASSILGGNGDTAGSVNSASATPVGNSIASSMGQMFGNLYSNIAQADLWKSQANKNESETQLNQIEANLKPLTFKEQQRVNNATIFRLTQAGKLDKEQANIARVNYHIIRATSQEQIDTIRAKRDQAWLECDKIWQESEKARKEGNLAEAKIEEVDASVVEKWAHAYQLYCQGNESKSHANLMDKQAFAQNMENIYVQFTRSGVPISAGDFGYIAAMRMRGNQEAADNYQNYLDEMNVSAYSSQINARWKNFGKEMLMGLGDAGLNLLNIAPFALPMFKSSGLIGKGAATVKGFGR